MCTIQTSQQWLNKLLKQIAPKRTGSLLKGFMKFHGNKASWCKNLISVLPLPLLHNIALGDISYVLFFLVWSTFYGKLHDSWLCGYSVTWQANDMHRSCLTDFKRKKKREKLIRKELFIAAITSIFHKVIARLNFRT